MKINLHIERLVLDGVDVEPHQRAGLKAAVEAELAGALARNGVASGLQDRGNVRAIRANSITVGEQNEPSRLGRQIGQAVYGGINR
jgi:hypothetical protein